MGQNLNSDDEIVPNMPTKVITHNYDESISQNILSTSADKQFQCKKCDKSFSGLQGLFQHNRSSHEGVKYPCTECDYIGILKTNLQKHVSAIHEGVKYQCTSL